MVEPLRVLELGTGVASAYAAKLMGDAGAEVVKVESPGGDPARRRGPFPAGTADPERSGMFLALNLNKRGITLDLPSARTELDRLLAWADVAVHDLQASAAEARGLDAASLRASYPGLVTLAITPFGQTGPYAEFAAEELTVANAGGWAYLCPSTSTDPTLPPLKVFGDQCALMSGIAGATAALAAARETRRSGIGEYIDLSEQAYVASVLEGAVSMYSYLDQVAARYHKRLLIPWRIFDAEDGPVFIVCVEQDQWERLVALMGHPDWADLPTFAGQGERSENEDLVHMFVQEFVSGWRAHDLYHRAQAERICIAPVMSLPELAANEHLRARGFFVEVGDGEARMEFLAPAALTTHGRAKIRHAAPRLGEHDGALEPPARSARAGSGEPRAPLAGVRVVDLTWAWAGPFCTLNLAHLGAEVIRVESAKRADLYRRLRICPEEWGDDLDMSGMFNQWHQGKASMSVDLGHPRGVELVKRLVAESDVVVQNFATGVMERLGLGYDTLRAINPRIILASVSGYGQTGPYRQYMGYGPAMPPLTGLSMATGYVGGGPEEFGLSMPDPTAGITAAMSVVAALLRRDETGEGDHLDVSLWEATGVLNMEGWMQYAMTGTEPARIGNRSPRMAPHGCFACAGDDAWVSIACRTDDEWTALARHIDPALADDARFATLADRKSREDELESIVSGWTAQQDRWKVTRLLQEAGIAAFPTMTAADIVHDPHLEARGFIERLEHPKVGRRAHAGIPWRLHARANGVASPAPCLGADTDRYLRELLGLSDEEVGELYREGVVGV